MPQRLLSDNGSALNPSRREFPGQLVAHVAEVGVEAITGKPYKPTTQGKNERFHQTLFRYLDKQPLAEDLAELQAQVDAFDHIYNTERPHQGLPGRVTPQAAWLATPKADPPRPQSDRPIFSPSKPVRRPRPAVPENLGPDTRIRTVNSGGTIGVDRVVYKLDVTHAFKQVLVISNGTDPGDTLTITDLEGEILTELIRPPTGVRYVGNNRRPGQRTRPHEESPKS